MVPPAVGGTTGEGPGRTPAGGSQADPLAVLDDLFVAQESIQPGWFRDALLIGWFRLVGFQICLGELCKCP